MTEVATQPKCRRCNGELTRDENRNCFICLTCYPPQKEKPAPTVEPEKKYLDVAMTEKRVREIVIDELENWHIQKPPVTRNEVKNLTATEAVAEATGSYKPLELNWRQQARELGIPLFRRKKADVLKEIEAKLKEA